jgi:3-oxoacyl-[acyl-carrier protein] reductase
VELTGQVALVTGASRGIGRAIAAALAEGGARVAVVGRNVEPARAAASELPGEGHRAYAADVADSLAVDALIKEVEEDIGPIDILVNNAGVTRDNLLMRLKDEDWDAVLDTNLRGAFNTIRAASRGMMKRRSGRIINITSVVGIVGNKGQANYAASKAGLIGLTKSVARELASRGDSRQRHRSRLHRDGHDSRSPRGRSGCAARPDRSGSARAARRGGRRGSLSRRPGSCLHDGAGSGSGRRDGHLVVSRAVGPQWVTVLNFQRRG